MRIHHVALRTQDLAGLERFYTGVLGFEVIRRDDARGSLWLDAAGAILMLERADPDEPPVPPGAKDLLAFAVDDTTPWRARVTVEAETPYTLYFRDPDGRRLAVSTYK